MKDKTIITIIIIIAITSIFVLHYINTNCKPVVKIYPGCPEVTCQSKYDNSKTGLCLKKCDANFDDCFKQCNTNDNECIKKCYDIKAQCYMYCTNERTNE